ncbi:MAG: DUF2207 domain-containing protein [Clostridia bacterium]
MKKFLKVTALVMLLILCNISYIFADEGDRSYYIDNYISNLTIQENGDATYLDEITYKFDGSFNGIYRNVNFKGNSKENGVMPDSKIYNAENLKDVEVSVKNEDGSLRKFYEDTNNQIGTYIMIQNNQGSETIKIFEPSSDCSKTFVVKYTLKAAAVTHLDTSEMYSGVFGDNEKIKHAVLNISVKGVKDISSLMAAYPHTTGTNLKVINSDNVCTVTVDNIGKDTLMDVRIVLDKAVVNSPKKTNLTALPTIEKMEKSLLKERESMKTKAGYIGLLIVIDLAFLVIALKRYFILFNKYEKEVTTMYQEEHSMEIPNAKRNPLEVAHISSNGTSVMDPNIVTNCIFDLVNKDYIKLESHKILNKKGKAEFEYNLTLNLEKPMIDQKSYVIDLVNLMFKTGNTINLKDRLKKLETNTEDYQKIEKVWQKSEKEYIKECVDKLKPTKEELNIGINMFVLISFIVSSIIMFISPVNSLLLLVKDYSEMALAFGGSFATACVTAFAGFIVACITTEIYKRGENKGGFIAQIIIMFTVFALVMLLIDGISKVTAAYCISTAIIGYIYGLIFAATSATRQKPEIAEERAKWLALKNYIRDYSMLKEKEAAHIVNWEEYMVYAITFGLASTVKKELDIQYKNGDIDSYPASYHYYMCYSLMSTSNSAARTASSGGSGGYSGGGGGGISGGGGAF